MAVENPKGNLVSRLPLVGPAYLFFSNGVSSLGTKVLDSLIASDIKRYLDQDEAFNLGGAFYILAGGDGDGTIDLNHFGPPPEYDKNGYPRRSQKPSMLSNLKNIFTRKK